MDRLKLLLFRLHAHRLLKPVSRRLTKLFGFFAFAEWVEQRHNWEVNDFPAVGNVYKRRYQVHQLIAQQVSGEAVNYLEFGVADCETFFWWLEANKNADSRFYGFDTFTGLPEDWGKYKKGTFSLDGVMPVVNDQRAQLHKGLFQDTLHDFLPTFRNDKQNIILLDADLYSSTMFVLATLAPFLKSGDVLIFDEFNGPQDEFLALQNFLTSFSYISVEPFAAANNYACVAFRVLTGRQERFPESAGSMKMADSTSLG